MASEQSLVERLRSSRDSGRRTLGGCSMDGAGKFTSWGGEPIMVLRNPDGHEAAARIEALEAENARLTGTLREIADVPDAACSREETAWHIRDTARTALAEQEKGA